MPPTARKTVAIPRIRPMEPWRPEKMLKPFSFVAIVTEKSTIIDAMDPAMLCKIPRHFQKCTRYLLV